MNQKHKNQVFINFSTLFIIKVALILFLIYLFFLVKSIVFILFLAFILSTAIEPWVDRLEKNKIPRGVGVIIIYLILSAVIAFFIYLVLNPVINQISLLAKNFPIFWQRLVFLLNQLKVNLSETGFAVQTQDFFGYLQEVIVSQIGGLLVFVKNILSGALYFLIILILAFLMLAEKDFWEKTLNPFIPKNYQPYLSNLIIRIKKKIGVWLKGQLALCFVIFVLVYLGLTLLGVKYALLLALFSGFTEFVPLIGPLIGELPAVFLTFFQSPILALWVILFYFIIQQLDANFLAPKIMQKAVGLNPVIIILSILSGAILGGTWGVIIAIPLAAILSIILKDFFENNRV